jgi:crossover junction endodeoxyribonuclease RuvC
MGYGIVQISGNTIELLTMGVLRLHKIDNHADKLKKIFDRTLMLIQEYHPDELAIEAPFYGKNVQSMLKLGRAQGVAMAAALHLTVPIFEYSPRKIKQSITGRGNASKEQVFQMLKRLLVFDDLPETLDASDGVAVALCHHFQQAPSSDKKSYSGWKSFLNNNPDRLAE